jgi:predicted dithiol-disulfide oxidoreductase (DUF899 family)
MNTPELLELNKQIMELKEKLAELRVAQKPEPVENYSFNTPDGTKTLLDLFGDKDDLLLIHNMGQSCVYCTLWADGMNGQIHHYENRSAFVLCSPDPVDTQAKFAMSRGWKFRMVSDPDKVFTAAMGYYGEDDGFYPGASGFRRDGDQIFRTGATMLGPGDDYCPIWPMMELIGGYKGWEPKYNYRDSLPLA